MPGLELEEAIRADRGACTIAGLDEAGRGALAGPVVAAAVILPLDAPERLKQLEGVDDSKKLSPRQRDALFGLIVEVALAYSTGSTFAAQIDEMGIVPANARAMRLALAQLDPPGEYLLIDGRMRLSRVALPQRSVIRGDGLSLSIAAASIVAKVTRDRHMVGLEEQYPQYGFASHKGYCTPQHVSALERYGPCPVHRFSFAPIRRPLL